MRLGATAAPGGQMRLAVLPFENLSGDPDQEFFSDGFTEELIAELGALKPNRFGVIARTTSMRYKGTSRTSGKSGPSSAWTTFSKAASGGRELIAHTRR